ncbi:acetylcholine receptor subunit beta-type lev-1-like [Argopecten irradians]|uniref:acetylcholine receptor subunit beta-type lev-1-like n=1 Tax=Argopecten irradians TaxID=31199 RepID=UPI003723DF19
MAFNIVSSIGCTQFVLLLLNYACVGVICDNSTYKTNLYVDLLTGYNSGVLPGRQYSSQLLNINMSFRIGQIQSFDEITGEFTIVGLLVVSWQDERLEWSPANYNGLAFTHFKQKEIWTPPFILGQSFDGIELIGNDEMHFNVLYTGVVNWNVPVKLSSSCDADVTYYPFDQQFCSVTLLPWGYTTNLIKINAIGSPVDATQYTESPIWDLVSATQQSVEDPVLAFTMEIKFKRKPLFFVMNFLLPTILMCFINMFAFLLPAESGERVGFCITVLLAIAVFLSIVSSALPQTSSPQMALLCYLLVVHITLSLMTLACTVCGLRFYFRSDQEQVPQWMAKLTRLVEAERSLNVSKSRVSPDISSSVKNIKPEDLEQDEDQNVITDVSWKQVSAVFDRACFVVFVVLALVCNIAFMVVLACS